MAVYARPSWRLTGQICGDLFTLGWGYAWWRLSWLTQTTIAAMADPTRQISHSAGQVKAGLARAAAAAGGLPLAGDRLRAPIDEAASSVGSLVGQVDAQTRQIEQAAVLVGWLVWVIPVLLWLVWWVPGRIRFIRESTAARRFIDSAADLDLFALRAMARVPMHEIAKITPDPVGDWRLGDREVIARLAELELRRAGLRAPTKNS